MKKFIFAAIALLAIVATGCSKSDDEKTEEVKKSLKEQIAGVWRSGDYWVSFDGKEHKPVEGEPIHMQGPHDPPQFYDGYNEAHFKINGIEVTDSGVYTVDGETITAYSGLYLSTTIKYMIMEISATSITVIITYKSGGNTCTEKMSFSKASNTPISKTDASQT